jgi:hypothetical protein
MKLGTIITWEGMYCIVTLLAYHAWGLLGLAAAVGCFALGWIINIVSRGKLYIP